MAFIDRETLVIGGGGRQGSEVIYVARVPGPEEEALSVEALLTLGPLDTAGDSDFFGVAASKSAIYTTANRSDGKGWIVQVDIRNLKDMTVADHALALASVSDGSSPKRDR